MNLFFPPAEDFGWARVDDAERRWDTGSLAKGIATVGAAGSTSVVVLDHGRLLVDEHWTDDGPDHREEVASVQKSIVSVLVGIARSKGLVDVDAPANEYLEPGWSRTGRDREGQITVRHVLSMTSGLTSTFEHEAEPGARWFYNTPVYMMLKPLLAAAAGIPYETVTADWLCDRIGMTDSRWEPRAPFPVPDGTPNRMLQGLRTQGFGPDPDGRWAHRMPDGSLATGMVTTARDLARFALLVQAGGTWDDIEVVDRAWLEEATRPSQEMNPAYGLLFWVNSGPGLDPAGAPIERLQPGAPDDLIAARGANQRMADTAPSLGVAVSRVGRMSGATMGDLHGVSGLLWHAVLDARQP